MRVPHRPTTNIPKELPDAQRDSEPRWKPTKTLHRDNRAPVAEQSRDSHFQEPSTPVPDAALLAPATLTIPPASPASDRWVPKLAKLLGRQVGSIRDIGSPQLLQLPQVREVEFKPSWSNGVKEGDISSFIVHMTGELAPFPCERCSRGDGPFKDCIMISSSAPEAQRRTFVSCSGCLYESGGERCSLQPTLQARITEPLRDDNDKAGSSPDDDRTTGIPIPQSQVLRPQGRWPRVPQDPRTKCRYCAQGQANCVGGNRRADKSCIRCKKANIRCNWDLTGATVRWSKKALQAFGMPETPGAKIDSADAGDSSDSDSHDPREHIRGSGERFMITMRVPSLRKVTASMRDGGTALKTSHTKHASGPGRTAATPPSTMAMPSAHSSGLGVENWEVTPGRIRVQGSRSLESELSCPLF